jgi:hypothetical protein
VAARQEKPVNFLAPNVAPEGIRAVHEDEPAAFWGAVALRESLLQIRQMALDVRWPLTPSLS